MSQEDATALEESKPPPPRPDPKAVEWFKDNSIPIGGILFIALAACLLLHQLATATDHTRLKDSAEILNNYVQAVAIIVGGMWAVFTFTKGRRFQESLILLVSGKTIVLEGNTYIVVNTRIQNIGQSKIKFLRGASTLEVYEYIKTSISEVITMPDNRLMQVDPLDVDDKYVEPNEIIYGTRFIAIPHAPDLGFRLDFKVISARQRYTWRTSCMVEKSTSSGNIDSENKSSSDGGV